MAPYKVPKTVEMIAVMPRNDIMKINRSALTDEREGADSADRAVSLPGRIR